jgi:hypothetical protein
MRSLGIALLFVLPCVAQQPSDEYVKTGYPKATVAGLYEQLVSRRIVIDTNNIRIVAGKIETITLDKDNKKAWKAVDAADPFELLFLLRPFVYYDTNNEIVFLRKDVYKTLAPVLPQTHFGQLEHFLKEGTPITKKGLLADPSNYNTYIWDVTDKVWRYPGSLLVVDGDDPAVKYHKLNGLIPVRSEVVVLPALAADHFKAVAAYQAKNKKE